MGDRPTTVDELIDALAELRKLPAADRAARAPELAHAATSVLSEVRRAAVVEATAQGVDLGLSSAMIRRDTATDHGLLKAALEILALPSKCKQAAYVAAALAPRATIQARAIRLERGMQHLTREITDEDMAILSPAAERAGQILGRPE